jgi:hypothetical protein
MVCKIAVKDRELPSWLSTTNVDKCFSASSGVFCERLGFNARSAVNQPRYVPGRKARTDATRRCQAARFLSRQEQSKAG